jgi:putative Ca2+/H+ antiporter (TMEM165/GDT1 family)
MRRLLALALVGLVAVAASGCSGVDAQETQSLLDRSTTAMVSKVRFLNFAIRMWMEGAPEGENFTVLPRACRAAYATIDSENLPELGRMTVVVRRNALDIVIDMRVPVPSRG